MHPIEIIMTISAVVAISAGVPQMIKLVKTKKSDEFNLSTWLMWVITQSVSTVYAVSINNPLLIVINLTWVTFYAVMTFLIVRYSHKSRKHAENTATLEPIPSTE